MTGEFVGIGTEAGAGEESLMGSLRNLKREEILEVLSEGFCDHCEALLQERIHKLSKKGEIDTLYPSHDTARSAEIPSADASSIADENGLESSNRRIKQGRGPWKLLQTPDSSYSVKKTNGHDTSPSPAYLNGNKQAVVQSEFEILLNDGLSGASRVDNSLPEEEKEHIRYSQVGRKKDFVYFENVRGTSTNVLQGLELHTRVFNAKEQKNIVEYVYSLQRLGQKGHLRGRTYSEPRKWMRGKGRVTTQFGCCYNYAVDKDGNPPGIIRDEDVDPLPDLFKQMIKRMVGWHILPATCIPNSCIVNIYDEGDCIPPHIDHHDFVRPFCTVSFLAECNILFGLNLKALSPGEFSGPFSLPLPVGSVLIFNGNGADIAKHCVPAVPTKRISITFRKMDDSKLPYRFQLDPELAGIKPLPYSSSRKMAMQSNQLAYREVQQHKHNNNYKSESETVKKTSMNDFSVEKNEFPPLSLSAGSSSKWRVKRFQ
ncbi:oxidoreductase, 2OG-Fe(II) oxygenase family protein [Quillaja saponaria]|uniref:Oxidoreductase, 2OG-Fe(II) oxygenase family protein n=1 Tax=Quillaja saponaria TaxID=32244 RepID=A0AAD7M166_QUISA|nr:oxidoreductase, 2OG-Fe(II) oxygenase family protein [Quillaja saponaria]